MRRNSQMTGPPPFPARSRESPNPRSNFDRERRLRLLFRERSPSTRARCCRSARASAPTPSPSPGAWPPGPDTVRGTLCPAPFSGLRQRRRPGAFSLHTDHHPFGIVWLHSTLPQRIARWGADVLVSALTIGPARGDVPVRLDRARPDPPDAPGVARRPDADRLRPALGTHRGARLPLPLRFADHRPGARRPLSRDGKPVARRAQRRGHALSSRPPDDPAARRRTRQRYADGRPFVLYLGTLEPRKNVEALVVACERMWGRRRSRPDLVLAGGSGWKTGRPPPTHRPLGLSATRSTSPATPRATPPESSTARPRRSCTRPWPKASGCRSSKRWPAARRSWPRRPRRSSKSAATPRSTPRPATSRPFRAPDRAGARGRASARRAGLGRGPGAPPNSAGTTPRTPTAGPSPKSSSPRPRSRAVKRGRPRIGIDARKLTDFGIGSYVRHLVEGDRAAARGRRAYRVPPLRPPRGPRGAPRARRRTSRVVEDELARVTRSRS